MEKIIYDNMSIDGRVGFIEKHHKYVDLENPSRKFTSVTGVLKDYKEPFNAEKIIKQVIRNPRSKYFGMDADEVQKMWDHARNMGTALHLYGENLLNGIESEAPGDERAIFVPQAIEQLQSDGYELAKTELLLYSTIVDVSGQSDIFLKKKYGDEYFYMIYDWKFMSAPLQKKSYYNRRTRKFASMDGPFRYLHDCNWMHYSIQLALYQTLTGDPAKVTEKVLIEVTDSGYRFIPAYPMRVYWNKDGLQAAYETWNGQWYDSRYDTITKTKPDDIVAL